MMDIPEIAHNSYERNSALYNEIARPLMVHVVAPATLPAGYTFDAQINGDPTRIFACEVPEGGVQEGQVFLAALPYDYPGSRLQAPTGAWKDQWYDCLTYGACHPHLLCAICCPQILMGQVMQRMQLTWLGEPGPLHLTRNTFKVVVTVVIIYYIYSSSMGIMVAPHFIWFTHLRFWGGIIFSAWFYYALCKTRENVRIQYSIDEETCLGCEDGCCSLCCTCCTVAQLARHTGDYETYPSVCFSETGHPPGTPLTV